MFAWIVMKTELIIIFGKNYKTIHAEVDAIKKLRYSKTKKKIDILVFRTNLKGKELMMAKPCQNCINSIMN